MTTVRIPALDDMTAEEPDSLPRGQKGVTSGSTVQTERIRLVTVTEAHYPFLWERTQDPLVSRHWRSQGGSISPNEFVATIWNGVLVQFVAVDQTTGDPVAWLICYDANLRNLRAYFAVVAFDRYRRSRHLFEAIYVFIDYLFETWPLRQLLIEVPEYNLPFVERPILRFGHRVGSIPEYTFMFDMWFGLDTFSIRRDEKLERARARAKRMLLPAAEVGPL